MSTIKIIEKPESSFLNIRIKATERDGEVSCQNKSDHKKSL